MPAETFKAELALALEACAQIREGTRARGCLLAWPNQDSTGIASLKALGLNSHALVILARVYCSKMDTMKSPRIFWVRSEAGFCMCVSVLKEQLQTLQCRSNRIQLAILCVDYMYTYICFYIYICVYILHVYIYISVYAASCRGLQGCWVV